MKLHPDLKPGYTGKLKNGLPYRCYAVDGATPSIVHGACFENNEWLIVTHLPDGSVCVYSEYSIDLPPVPEPPQVDWDAMPRWCNWVAMDKNGTWYVYQTKPDFNITTWARFPNLVIPPAYAPKWSGDWRESLVARPGTEVQG